MRRATVLRSRLSRLGRVRIPLHYDARILSLGLWGQGPTLEQLQRERVVRQAELLRPVTEPGANRS